MSPQAAAAFRALHHDGRPLLLPNAWDFASAAALARAGFTAIGTTSLGVAAAAGVPDAAGRTRAETLAVTRRLVRLPVLVTVDIEAGFSERPDEVAALAEALASVGAVGVNLEDSRPGAGLAPPDRQCDLIRAVKQRAPHLFLNARTDTHWLAGHPPSLSDTLWRVERYVAAGADGVFVPGLTDPAGIAAVVAAVDLPVNVLYAPGSHTVDELAALGVRRVSTGSLLFRAAIHAAVSAAERVRDGGTVTADLPSYTDVQRLADPRPRCPRGPSARQQ
jgi:2-methylisocitrate lyase-like PEP mutase family enzyme